jgi:hypothetical protein
MKSLPLLPVSVKFARPSVPATGAVRSTVTPTTAVVALLPAASLTTARNR